MTEKLVYSAVAIPGEPDYDGEILTPEEIQYAAHKFMSKYRVIDPEHVCALTGKCYSVGTPVESVILANAMTVKSVHGQEEMLLPKGTWVLGIEVTDDSEWNRIVTGKATGLSLTAGRASVTKSRVLIRDLGKNWEAKTVSIVRDPAVPKAKFFQIGSGMMTEEVTKSRFESFFEKIEEAVKNFKADATEEPVEEPVEEDVEAVKSEEETIEPEEVEVEVSPEEEEVRDDDSSEEAEVTDEAEEEVAEDAVKFVTAEDLEQTKAEILEAVKSLMQPGTEDEAVKAEPEEEESEEETEEESKPKDDEDLDEIRKKDLKIAELEKKIEQLEAKLKTANKSRSKGMPYFGEEKPVVKNLYEDDNRDLYGRVIR